MRNQVSRLSALFMVLLLLPVPDWATCGGGGGGGMGGMRSSGPSGGPGGMGDEQVYQVPWKLVKPDDTLTAGGLVVYWFPSSGEEFQRSSLRNSRSLSLYASQCVTMGVADANTSLGQNSWVAKNSRWSSSLRRTAPSSANWKTPKAFSKLSRSKSSSNPK